MQAAAKQRIGGGDELRSALDAALVAAAESVSFGGAWGSVTSPRAKYDPVTTAARRVQARYSAIMVACVLLGALGATLLVPSALPALS
jgi:hypothetical protein